LFLLTSGQAHVDLAILINSRLRINIINSKLGLNTINSKLRLNIINSKLGLNTINSKLRLNIINSKLAINTINSKLGFTGAVQFRDGHF
jgi:hypothetical protein